MYPSIYWGDLLRSLRKRNHLLQKEVALILRISRQSYSQLETGRVQPSPEQLAVLSNIYDTNLLGYVMKCFPTEYVEEQSRYRTILRENVTNESAKDLLAPFFPQDESGYQDSIEDPLAPGYSALPPEKRKIRKKATKLREPFFRDDEIE